MSGWPDYYKQYTRLLAAIRDDLLRWECLYNEMPDAIFLSGEAQCLLGRDLLRHEPCTWATQQLYPVQGPIEPPVREYHETLYGVRVYQYHADGIEYYFARKGAF